MAGIEPVADAIAAHRPDVVSLQEVDRNTQRSGRVDQTERLAERAGLPHAIFGPATDWAGGGEYGIALLSRHPLRDVRTWPLYVPTEPEVPEGLREPRLLLSATVVPEGAAAVRVHATHFGLSPEQRAVQAREVAAAAQQSAVWAPTVVMGDLNAPPRAKELVPLRRLMEDAHATVPEAERGTFPSDAAPDEAAVIDYVLLLGDHRVREARVPSGGAELSDHRPCLAEVAFDV